MTQLNIRTCEGREALAEFEAARWPNNQLIHDQMAVRIQDACHVLNRKIKKIKEEAETENHSYLRALIVSRRPTGITIQGHGGHRRYYVRWNGDLAVSSNHSMDDAAIKTAREIGFEIN